MLNRLLFVFIAFVSLFFSNRAQAAYQPCELTVQEDVHWAAIDETVTLHFTMKGDGEYFPEGKVTMAFADGREIELARGGKYIDEGDDIGCAAQISTVKSALIGNLSGQYKSFAYERELTTLREAEALFNDEAFCAQTLNPYTTDWLAEAEGDETRLSKIEQSSIWLNQYLTCNPVLENIPFIDGEPSGMDISTYQRLLSQDAPFIDIPYAYGSETFVFDRENLALISFSVSGC